MLKFAKHYGRYSIFINCMGQRSKLSTALLFPLYWRFLPWKAGVEPYLEMK